MNNPDPLAEARQWEALGRLDRALAEYERLAAAEIDGAHPWLRQAEIHKELGRLAPAMAALEQAEAVAPDEAEPKLRLAQTTTSIGRDIAAVRYLEEARRLAPEQDELAINLADICSRLGWVDQGYWAVRPLPENLSDWWARARKTSLDQRAEALSTVKTLLRRRKLEGGIDHGLTWELAQPLYALGRFSIALALCRKLIDATPDVFAPHDLVAKIIARRDGPSAALAYLSGVSEAVRQDRGYTERTARLLNELKRFEEVYAAFEARPEMADAFDARYLSAVALLSLGRIEDLRSHCRRWMEQSPAEVLPAGVIACAQPVRPEPDEAGAPDQVAVDLVQFWDKPDVPPDVRRVLDSWVEMHPQLRRTLFCEEQARAFLLDEFGSAASAVFDLCHHAAMKADYFRIAYLYRRGGLYVDADERCLRPMGSLLSTAAVSEMAAVRSGDVMGYLHNFLLGARAGSRVLELALREADRAILAKEEGQALSIWHATGPGLITRAVGQYLVEDKSASSRADVYLLPFRQYRSFVATASDLSYKTESDANWQLME